MPQSREYHRMGGPADKAPPSITYALRVGTLWRGLAHTEKGPLDIGDIAILEHARKGIECYLFAAERRMYLPYTADNQWALDRHNHIRIGDGNGKVKLSLAPAE